MPIKKHNPIAVRLLLEAAADLQCIDDTFVTKNLLSKSPITMIKKIASLYCINMATFFQKSSSIRQTESWVYKLGYIKLAWIT